MAFGQVENKFYFRRMKRFAYDLAVQPLSKLRMQVVLRIFAIKIDSVSCCCCLLLIGLMGIGSLLFWLHICMEAEFLFE